MTDHSGAGKYLLIAGLAICLVQVWLPEWWLTGDGPCHLYNAQIVHDSWTNTHTDFYSAFYSLSYRPDPNWLSTFLLALLLFVAKGAVAEKLLLSIYVLCYVGGFYRLLRRLSNGSSYWPLALFVFVFTHALTKGFYNFSFGVAFYLWMVGSWIGFLDARKLANALLFLLFALLTFFSHLLPFAFGAATCAALVVSYSGSAIPASLGMQKGRYFIRQAIILTLLLLPFLILMLLFTQHEGGVQVHFAHHFYRLIELMQFKHAVNLFHSELLWTTVAGSTIVLLFVGCGYRYRQVPLIHKYDGLVLSLLGISFIYLFSEEDIIGRAMDMSIRTQLFVMILLVCIIAYRLHSPKLKNVAAFLIMGCFIVLSGVRLPGMMRAAAEEKQLMASGPYIKPASVVFPIYFAPGGINSQGDLLLDWNFSFRHVAQYLGTEKPLILLDNYEANMGYFPARWKAAVNPYRHLGDNIERIPPIASIAAYKQSTGVAVDYILMYGYDPAYLKDEQFKKLNDEIANGYHLVYTAPGGHTILFEKN